MNLSVVIASRDRAVFLERALASLAAQSAAPEYEVIVADNGSSDDTAGVVARAAERAAFPVRRVFVPEPNRAAARNAGLSAAGGRTIVFVDDDVWLPPGFLAAHAAAHRGIFPLAVSGPILNVPSYDDHPRPGIANYSRAFLCTCNVSVPRSSLIAVEGFDEGFNLYGWEDTDLGLRLRRRDVRRFFAWDAFLYHIKPPQVETLDTVLNKTVERARMAARFLRKDGGLRTRLATGAYGANLLRARLFAPAWSQGPARAVAENGNLPAPLRALARAQLLDAAYTSTLRRALAEVSH